MRQEDWRRTSRLYSWHRVAPFSLASLTSPSTNLALDSDTTGTMAASSSGRPTVSLAMPAFTCAGGEASVRCLVLKWKAASSSGRPAVGLVNASSEPR